MKNKCYFFVFTLTNLFVPFDVAYSFDSGRFYVSQKNNFQISPIDNYHLSQTIFFYSLLDFVIVNFFFLIKGKFITTETHFFEKFSFP